MALYEKGLLNQRVEDARINSVIEAIDRELLKIAKVLNPYHGLVDQDVRQSASPKFAKLFIDNIDTYLDKDDSDNLILHDDVIGTKTLAELAAGASGEANTGSNRGVGGVGVFYQKSGVDLQFKNINVASDKVVVSDDLTDHEIDIDLDQSKIDHDQLLNFLAIEHFLQSEIVEVGTVATGVWQGTPIANDYIAGLDQDLLTTSSPTFDVLTLTDIKTKKPIGDIRAYGAKCDGETDDTTAIQAAIDATTYGAGWYVPVFIPIGTTIFSSLTLHAQTRILGAHPTLSVLKRKSGSTGVAMEDGGNAGKIQLENFTINCNSQGTDGIKLGFNTYKWNYMAWCKSVRVMNHTGGIGFNIKTNVAELVDCWAESGLKGFYITAECCRLFRCVSEGHSGTGAYEFCFYDADFVEAYSLHVETTITDKPIQIDTCNMCFLNNIYVGVGASTTITDIIEFLTSGDYNGIRDLKINISQSGADFTNAIKDNVNLVTIAKGDCYSSGSFYYLDRYIQNVP